MCECINFVCEKESVCVCANIKCNFIEPLSIDVSYNYTMIQLSYGTLTLFQTQVMKALREKYCVNF